MEEDQFQAIRRSLSQIRWMVTASLVMLLIILVFLTDRIFPS